MVMITVYRHGRRTRLIVGCLDMAARVAEWLLKDRVAEHLEIRPVERRPDRPEAERERADSLVRRLLGVHDDQLELEEVLQ